MTDPVKTDPERPADDMPAAPEPGAEPVAPSEPVCEPLPPTPEAVPVATPPAQDAAAPVPPPPWQPRRGAWAALRRNVLGVWFLVRLAAWALGMPLKALGRGMAWAWGAPELSITAANWLARGMALASTGLSIYVSHAWLRTFTNSADEEDYVWVSERLLEGRLSLPPPAVPDAVNFWWRAVKDGRMLCQYPPTWPALMAPGTALGMPWLSNCVIGGLIVYVAYLIGRDTYRRPGVGLVAAAFLAVNPMLIFNAAAYFPHPATILFSGLTLWLLSLCAAGEGWAGRRPAWGGFLAGVCAGILASMRPPDAVASLLVAALLTGGVLLWRPRDLVRFVPAAVAGAVVGVLPLLLHNHWATGSFTKTAYTLFAAETVNFKFDLAFWRSRLNVLDEYRGNFREWGIDPALVAAAIPLLWLAPGTWRRRLADLGLVGVFPLVAVNLLAFPWSGLHFNSYGPRYASMLLIPTAVLLGRALLGLLVHPRLALVSILALGVWQGELLKKQRDVYKPRVTERTTLFRAMDSAPFDNVVVFMKSGSGSMDRNDMTRNDAEYKNRVVYAIDRNPSGNVEAWAKMFPGRTALLWNFESGERGTLAVLDPTLGRPVGPPLQVRNAKVQSASLKVPAPVPPPYTLTAAELYHQQGETIPGGWNLWANGTSSAFINLPVAGTFRFTAYLRGEPAGGEDPEVKLEVDGKALRTLRVPGGTFLPYPAPGVELGPGLHQFGITFTNDWKGSSGDRNVHIQKVEVARE